MCTEADIIAASERAEDLEWLDRSKEATEILQAALEEAQGAHDEALALLLRAQLALTRGRYEEQLGLAQEAQRLRPDLTPILRAVGVALLGLFRFPEAAHWFRKALERGDDHRALHGLGAALGNMGDVATALGLFERSLAIAPDYFIALRDKGIVLGLLGRKREAAECLSRSLRMNPTNWPAGFWLRKFASPEEAAALIEEVRPDRSGSCAAPPQPAQEEKTRHGEAGIIGYLLGAAEHRRQMVDIWRRLSARSAHRIGNQLFAALGPLRTLEQLRDPQSAEAVLDLRASLQRIAGVTREFQTFSSNEPPRRRITEIGPLVRDIARRYGALAEGTAVTARVADDLPRCSLDRTQMDDALGELVENALHQTPRGGRVTLSAEAFHEEGEPRVRILVEDTGPGIAPQVKQRLFEPFVTTRPGGSGLGLAIVKQIVENHGGTIRETGKPGEGARFEVQLPALPSEEARP